MAETPNFNSFFAAVPVSEFPGLPRGLVTIPSTSKIVDAARVLADNAILCAPVRNVDAPDTAPWHQKYAGILDVVGIALSVLDATAPGKHCTFVEMISRKRSFSEKTVDSALAPDESVRRFGPFIPLHTSSTLLDAMALLSSKHRLHRVPVVETGGDIVNIITQSALLRFIDAHKAELAAVGSQTLAALGLAVPSPVFTISIEATTVDAFKLIRDKNVSAVGVVGREGMLVGVVSARDVRTIVASPVPLDLMHAPLRVFFEAMNVERADVSNPAIRCQPRDTLEMIVTRMVSSRVHRIFVVDEHGHPQRVVSITDVLGQYISVPAAYVENLRVNGLEVLAQEQQHQAHQD